MTGGRAPIVSPHIRVRHPDDFMIGPGSVIDDYSYFSTRVRVGTGSHIAAGCTIAGGRAHLFSLGDFSSLSAGVRVWCSSNDYARDLICITPEGLSDADLGVEPLEGDVLLADYTGVGANAVIMPGNTVPEGVAIGALSFVPARYAFEPWTLYAGIPVRPLASRDRPRILHQAALARAALEASG